MRFLLLMLLSFPAAAALQVWTFDDVHFIGGGDLLGTLTYDRELHRVVDWDITTTAGTLSGFHYTPQNATTPRNYQQLVIFDAGSRILLVSFAHDSICAGCSTWGLDGGGPLLIQNGESDYMPLTLESQKSPDIGRIVQGYPVIAQVPAFSAQLVPEPSVGQWLLCLGLLLAVKYVKVLR